MRGDHRMPPSPALENVVRSRLSLSPKFDLEKQDVYFAHFKDGLKAKYQRDLELSKASGLAAFEARLASFLISDRYNAYVLKVIREIKPLAASLSGSIASVKAAALSDRDKLRQTILDCRKDLEMIERKKSAIETLVANTRAAAEMAAQRSFEAKIGAIAHEMPRRLEGLKLGIEGFWDKLGAGTIKNQKWVKATAERINAILREELETWAGADNDHEGLARDLKPSMDQMVSSLRDHVEDISDIVNAHAHAHRGSHGNLSSEGKIVGDIDGCSLISATLLGGPLGVVGLGGWRGVAGAVGGFVGASFAIGLVTGIAPGISTYRHRHARGSDRRSWRCGMGIHGGSGKPLEGQGMEGG